MGSIAYLKTKAISNRATCQECRQKIELGAPVIVLYHTYFGDSVKFHRRCLVAALCNHTPTAIPEAIEKEIQATP